MSKVEITAVRSSLNKLFAEMKRKIWSIYLLSHCGHIECHISFDRLFFKFFFRLVKYARRLN